MQRLHRAFREVTGGSWLGRKAAPSLNPSCASHFLCELGHSTNRDSDDNQRCLVLYLLMSVNQVETFSSHVAEGQGRSQPLES